MAGRHWLSLAELVDGDFDDDLPRARLHGDLWSGNVVFTASGAVLIDPAAHGGHGLTELAQLELFGLAHLDRVGPRAGCDVDVL